VVGGNFTYRKYMVIYHTVQLTKARLYLRHVWITFSLMTKISQAKKF
jgi:hypothetical protein